MKLDNQPLYFIEFISHFTRTASGGFESVKNWFNWKETDDRVKEKKKRKTETMITKFWVYLQRAK